MTNLFGIIAAVLGTIAPVSALPPSPAQAIQAPVANDTGVGGTWKGNLLQLDWTFRFTSGPDGWSGEYMVPGGVKWYPLADVAVTGRAVSFTMDTKPKMRFALAQDTATQALAGTAVVEGLATIPFTATRQP